MGNGNRKGFLRNFLGGENKDPDREEKKKVSNEQTQEPEKYRNENNDIDDKPDPGADTIKKKPSKISEIQEFIYLEKLIRYRLNAYFPRKDDIEKPQPPKLDEWSLFVPEIIKSYLDDTDNSAFYEPVIIILLLSLVPYVLPDLLDDAINDKLEGRGDFRKIGGVRGKNFRGFIPTYETAVFLIAGEEINDRQQYLDVLSVDSFLLKKQIIQIEEPPPGDPMVSGILTMEQEFIEYFTSGKITRPKFGMSFPAQLIETPLEWTDLVLPQETMSQIDELKIWINHQHELSEKWSIGKKLKPGYRVLFHGPPGTGKTMTASLLGKVAERDVYKIDLSMVISKYIGETEKNLARLFDKAKNKDWILFFDEADALFGKRTSIRDAHDKYANQEVSYLLQRIEDFPGLVILASNFRQNIDEAFTRRFQDFIYFPPPRQYEKVKLWQTYLVDSLDKDHKIDINGISKKYELNGGNIVNIVRYAYLKALAKNADVILEDDLFYGIKKEYEKEGKVF